MGNLFTYVCLFRSLDRVVFSIIGPRSVRLTRVYNRRLSVSRNIIMRRRGTTTGKWPGPAAGFIRSDRHRHKNARLRDIRRSRNTFGFFFCSELFVLIPPPRRDYYSLNRVQIYIFFVVSKGCCGGGVTAGTAFNDIIVTRRSSIVRNETDDFQGSREFPHRPALQRGGCPDIMRDYVNALS